MKQFNKIAALLLALLMLLSLTILPAFAEEEADGEILLTATSEGDSVTLTSEEEGTGEVVDYNELFGEEETDGETEEVTTTGAEETAEDVVTTTAETAEKKGLSTNAIIWIVVGGVVLVAAVVLCIIFREKVGKFFRVYKSEIKKVVWLPWDQTKKSTLVVLVILIICATAICLVDLGLSKGFLAFLKLFQKA